MTSATRARLLLNPEVEPAEFTDTFILCKPNSLEFFKINTIEGGLDEQLFEVPVYANLRYVHALVSSNKQKPDAVFVLTEDLQFTFSYISKNMINLFNDGTLLYDAIEKLDEIQVAMHS